MESLRLALEMLDRVEEAEQTHHPLNPKVEAKRLVQRHPEADVSEKDVAEVLREEIAATRDFGSIM